MRRVLRCAAWIALLGIPVASPSRGDYKFRWINIGQLPGPCDSSGPGGVNDAGVVVGTSFLDCPPNYTRRGWIWDIDSRMLTPLVEPTCTIGNGALLINNRGSILGATECTRGSFDWWLLSPDGELSWLLPIPGESRLLPTAMNNRDEVVGRFVNAGGARTGGFYWSPETGMMRLSDRVGGTAQFWANGINNDGWILGSGDISPRWWLWTPEEGLLNFALLSGINSSAIGAFAAINDAGQITGYGWNVARQEYNTFLWTPELGTRWLPLLLEDWVEYEQSWPLLMNDRGVILGRFESLEYVADWIWDERRGMREFSSEAIDPCGTPWNQGIIWYTQMNSSGQILVYAQEYVGSGIWRDRAVVLDPYIPGDLDEDGDCDLQDLAYLLANFARAGDATYANGDLDCDADVDLQDLGILLGNFGETLP